MEQLTIFDILNNTTSDELTDAEIVQFLGREKEFDDSTQISVSTVNTLENNEYFPAGCAMISLYLLSDNATGSILLANKFALNNRLDWVEYRHYDHRYFKKYNHGFMLHDVREKPHMESLESYKQLHFIGGIGDIYFGNTGRLEYSIKRIKDFLEWDF